MKKILLTASILSSLVLTACGGQSTTSSSTNTGSSQSQSAALPKQVAQNEFEWNWLASYPVTSIEETVLYSKNYYFILDGSGSMDERPGSCNSSEIGMKIDIAKSAIQQFVETLPSENNVGLLAFDSNGITERTQLAVGNRSEFSTALSQVQANSGTPLKSAIKTGYHHLRQQAANQAGHGEYNIIVVTDGDASSGENPNDIVKEIAKNSPVNLYTIGFCIGDSHVLNNKEYVHYYKANDAASIVSSLSQVLAESDEVFD